ANAPGPRARCQYHELRGVLSLGRLDPDDASAADGHAANLGAGLDRHACPPPGNLEGAAQSPIVDVAARHKQTARHVLAYAWLELPQARRIEQLRPVPAARGLLQPRGL